MIPSFIQSLIDNHFRDVIEGTWGGDHPFGGIEPSESSVFLNQNDYLGLTQISNHISPTPLARDPIKRPMMSMVMDRSENDQRKFERKMASYIGAEDILLCQSGYAANIGLLQAITSPNLPVYIDSRAHMSLWEGIKAGEGKIIPFSHNNALSLLKKVQRHGPGIIVFDTIYSTDGAVAPIEDFVEIAKSFDCALVADESHAIGVIGPMGRGLVAESGFEKEVHFITASLSKAFISRAGIITCSSRMREYLLTASFPQIFSTAVLPDEIKAMEEILEVVSNADESRNRLKKIATEMRKRLVAYGFDITGGNSIPIIAIVGGSAKNIIKVRDFLQERNIFGAVFCPPATSDKRVLIRLTLHSELKIEEMNHVLSVCQELLNFYHEEIPTLGIPKTRFVPNIEVPIEKSMFI